MARLLDQDFYARDPRIVARELLGKVLVRSDTTGIRSGRIVEVEVYLGSGDMAAHSAAGRTARNEVLFGPPGHAYVYFIYGMHYCLNFSCMPEGDAGCVLLRAVEPLEGVAQMARARKLNPSKLGTLAGKRMLASGPGRLCAALSITRKEFNGVELFRRDSRLRVIDDGSRAHEIVETERIGIRQSADLPLRYFIAGNPYVSGNRSAVSALRPQKSSR